MVANPQKPRSGEIIERIVRCGERLGMSVRVATEIAEVFHLDLPMAPERDLAQACDLLIACGGDGTILYTARLVAGDPRPILGVNLGRLGFLAELAPDRVEEGLTRIRDGHYSIDERMMLAATVEGSSRELIGLNDIIIAKDNSSRIISIELRDGSQWVNTYVADGLILATPTGSTGYALAAGGPIVTPRVDAIIAAPICPHSLTVRPMIFGGSTGLDIRVFGAHDSRILLSADAQTPHWPLPSGQTVHVRRADRRALLLHLETSSYYDILRQKLHWGVDKSLE